VRALQLMSFALISALELPAQRATAQERSPQGCADTLEWQAYQLDPAHPFFREAVSRTPVDAAVLYHWLHGDSVSLDTVRLYQPSDKTLADHGLAGFPPPANEFERRQVSPIVTERLRAWRDTLMRKPLLVCRRGLYLSEYSFERHGFPYSLDLQVALRPGLYLSFARDSVGDVLPPILSMPEDSAQALLQRYPDRMLNAYIIYRPYDVSPIPSVFERGLAVEAEFLIVATPDYRVLRVYPSGRDLERRSQILQDAATSGVRLNGTATISSRDGSYPVVLQFVEYDRSSGQFVARMEYSRDRGSVKVVGRVEATTITGIETEYVAAFPDHLLGRVWTLRLEDDGILEGHFASPGTRGNEAARRSGTVTFRIPSAESSASGAPEPIQSQPVVAPESTSSGRSAAAMWNPGQLYEGSRTYRVLANTKEVGQYTESLSRESQSGRSIFRLTSEAKESGILGRLLDYDTVTVDAGTLAPLQIHHGGTTRWGPKSVTLVFEPARVRGHISIPLAGGGRDSDVNTALPPGTLVYEQIGALVPALPLSSNGRWTLSVFNGATGEVMTVVVRVTGESVVGVPAGLIDCWTVEVSGGPLPMTVHVAKATPHLIARFETGGGQLYYELVRHSP